MSIGLLNHHVKKGSKISGGDDGPGPEPVPQALALLTVSTDNIYYVIQYRCWCRGSTIIIHDCHLRGEGGGVFMTVM